MKVAYIFDPANLHSTTFSGVVRQALMWASGLSNHGVEIEYPVAHETFDWAQCDLLHLFQYGAWAEKIIEAATRYNVPVVLSPIVDRPKPYGWLGRLISSTPFEFFGLRQRHRTLSVIMARCEKVLARSEREKNSLSDVSANPSNIEIVRLGIERPTVEPKDKVARSRHVFHMSHLNQTRKNVRALVEACRLLGIPLRLAGKISDVEFSFWLDRQCRENPKLKYLGTLSEKRKWEEMGEAAVFCLPSLNEGIGLVALEAYVAGANIVMTNRSGGVEYFDDDIEICDPDSITDISRCIQKAMKKPAHHGYRLNALENLSMEHSAQELFRVYSDVVSEKATGGRT